MESGEPIYIPEGEAHCDRLKTLGLTATTNAFGAGRWMNEWREYFHNARVVILPDNDPPGLAHAEEVARSLYGSAAGIKVVRLLGLEDKGDVIDWLDAGGTADELTQIVDEWPVWEPSDTPSVDDRATPRSGQVKQGKGRAIIYEDKSAIFRIAGDYRLTPSQIWLLQTLLKVAKSATGRWSGNYTRLAEDTRLSRATVTKTVSQLSALALISVVTPVTNHSRGELQINCYANCVLFQKEHGRATVYEDKFAIFQIAEEFRLTPNESWTLQALVKLASFVTGRWLGTYTGLAEDTRLSRASVSRVVGHLAQLGLLTVVTPSKANGQVELQLDCYATCVNVTKGTAASLVVPLHRGVSLADVTQLSPRRAEIAPESRKIARFSRASAPSTGTWNVGQEGLFGGVRDDVRGREEYWTGRICELLPGTIVTEAGGQ
ncbi:MAG: hypothetical protein ACYDGN_12960 [Acidimicrobiales bacterium]